MPASVVALLEQLIRVDSHNPGGDEQVLAHVVAEELALRRPDALSVVPVPRPDGPAGAYVLARWGQPELLVNAHLDTVPPSEGWTSSPFSPRVDGCRVVGLGAADTKGAIAAAITALDGGEKPRDLALLFSGDEERSGSCLRAFLGSPDAQGIERAIVCEPTSLRAGTRHRGILALEASLAGEGGHSSRADALPSPIADLARVAVAVDAWGKLAREQGPPGFLGLCMNVAKLAGGVAFNVVPDRASLTFSLRPPPGSDARALHAEITALVRRVAPATSIDVLLDNPPFATRDLEGFRPLLGPVCEAPIDLGFWTEAAVLSAAGIDAVVLGPGDIAQAHAPDEWVAIDQLEDARRLLATIYRAAAKNRAGPGRGSR